MQLLATHNDETQDGEDIEASGGHWDAETEAEVDGGQEEVDGMARHISEGLEGDMEGDDGHRPNTAGSRHGSRGRSASRTKKDTSSVTPRRTTRSASKPRQPAGAPTTPSASRGATREQPPSSKAKGKEKASSEVVTSEHQPPSSPLPSQDIGLAPSSGRGNGKRGARGFAGVRGSAGRKLTLKDIVPVEIPLKDVPHV